MNGVQQFGMIYIGLILLGVFIILTVTNIVYRDKPGDHSPADEEDTQEPKYEHLETNASVVDMTCGVEVKGIKTVKAVKTFRVSFELESGKVITLTIPEEMYEGIEVGQKGKLTLVDGELYGFEV